MEGKYCRLHVRVRAETSMGQVVAIGGSSYSLGHFDEDKTVQLVTTPDSYPVWYTDAPIIVPRDQVIQYNYCIIEGGKVRAFESVEKRTVISNEIDSVVEDEFKPQQLAGGHKDSEANLFEEMKMLQGLHPDQAVCEISSDSRRLILVCYHLPVKILRSEDIDTPFTLEWAESLIARTSGSIADSRDTQWVGTISAPGENLSSEEIEFLVAELAKMNCTPVFLDTEVQRLAYHGYCKQILWPVFHNVDQLDQIHAAWNVTHVASAKGKSSLTSSIESPVQRSFTHPTFPDRKSVDWSQNADEYFPAYQSANNAFLNALLPIVRSGDTVWVHDYHLSLLPKMLRDQEHIKMSIIFFLHLPFPTSQVP